jgi:hypothetical protein
MVFAEIPMMDQRDQKSDQTDNRKSYKKKFSDIHDSSPSLVSIKPIRAKRIVEDNPAARINPREKSAPLKVFPKTIPAKISLDMSRKYFPISRFCIDV